MINVDWTVLSEEQTRKFIAEVRDPDFAPLFDGPAYALWAYDLPFFEGYARYSLNKTDVIPYFSMDYISNGENHYYLDGSAQPIRMLMQRGAVKISRDNVLQYLDFYDDVVFDPARKIKFIIDAYDTGYGGASAMEHHFKAIEYSAQKQIMEFDTYFLLRVPALYQGETINAQARVTKDGEITLEAPASLALTAGEQGRTLKALRYCHPHEAPLIETNSALLAHSALGALMLGFMNNYSLNFRVLCGITRQGFWTDGNNAYISVPATVNYEHAYQVIDMAGVLREAEIFHLNTEKLEDASLEELQHARNLDVLLTLCRMVGELEDAGLPDFLACSRKMGLETLYAGYKNGLDSTQLMDIYAELYERQNRSET